MQCTALTFKVFKFMLNDSTGLCHKLFVHAESYRAVLAAASPSLLGPSLLQEGSEAEDMVSVDDSDDSNSDEDDNDSMQYRL